MVLIGMEFDMMQIREKYETFKLYQSGHDYPFGYMSGFVVRKSVDVTIKRKYSILLNRIYNLGIVDFNDKKLPDYHIMINKFRQQKVDCSFRKNENINYINLNLSQLQFCFILVSFGTIFSFYIFILEILYSISFLNLFSKF